MSSAAYAKYEDSTLRKVLGVCLDASQANAGGNPPVLFLGALAEELRAEAGDAAAEPLLLSRDNAERALMARLSEESPAGAQWPVHYLLGVYGRAADELRNVGLLKDASQQAALTETLQLCRQLAVSYSGLILSLDMFPQPPEAQRRGALQLLDSLDAAAAASAAATGLAGPGFADSGGGDAAAPGGAAPMPPGFLEDFAFRFADEGLPDLVAPIATALMQRASKVSLLGDYSGPLSLMARLAAAKPLARALTQLPSWLPAQQDGRTLEGFSILGPFFGISALPDIARMGMPPVRQPDVAAQCFSNAATRRPGDLRQSIQAIQAAAAQLRGALHSLVMLFLKNQETRGAMLDWLAAALNSNGERIKMRPNAAKACTDGFAINLAGVLLKLCEPFIDPLSGKAWGKLDVRYSCDPSARLHHGPDDTRLHATSEETAQWFASVGPPADGKYHFICECFFMAARALQMGLKKNVENFEGLARSSHHYQEDFDAMLPAQQAALEGQRMKLAAAWLQAAAYCYDATLQDQSLLSEALAFYRQCSGCRHWAHHLGAAAQPCLLCRRRPPACTTRDDLPVYYMLLDCRWRHACLRAATSRLLPSNACQTPAAAATASCTHCRLSASFQLRLASPTAAVGGPPSLPLPDPPAKEICVLPEYFMEDLGELLLWVGRVRPDLVEPRRMEDFMVYCTVFLGSPSCVRNAYLRGKMVEALHSYMPHEDSERQRHRQPASASEVALLFEVHPLVIQHMVGSLLQLYIDIEITDRHNQFYEKFATRQQIGEILVHLWGMPQHRAAWRQLATDRRKLNVQFIHVLLNDSQYLLQEALNKLPQVQETERLQADAAAWAALPAEQQRERATALQQAQGQLKYYFRQSSVVIKLMQLTAEDGSVCACYFDDAVRNRTAKINDFFLKYLTVPEERRKLRLKEPEKFGWHPKELITQLAQIHLYLYRARQQEWVQAVAADTDYYGRAPQLFAELTSVLRALGLLPADDVAALERMTADVEAYKSSVQEEEEAFEDVPEEFEDPLLGGVMRDPVRLPSGNVVERSSIAQQLLTDPRDPYSRQRCTEEDLVPLPELKARIEAWVAEQRSKRMQS
ncbi:hypothetical protein ABPG77_009844 [Micractinium sp. CCAP 211/92]